MISGMSTDTMTGQIHLTQVKPILKKMKKWVPKKSAK